MVYDVETETCMRIASHLTFQQKRHWPEVRHLIRERCEMFRSGRIQAPHWFRRRLKELDSLLEVRWDYIGRQWVVERYSRADRAYVTVMKVDGSLGLPVIHELEEGDTWRFPTPEAYLAWKHEQSARRRAQIEKEGDEKVAAAIDSLSTKQAEEFVAVEQAAHSGETIVLHGQSAKIMDHMAEGSKRALAQGITPPAPLRPMVPRIKKPRREKD